MKNCVECNEQLEDDARFCSNCRARQPEKTVEPLSLAEKPNTELKEETLNEKSDISTGDSVFLPDTIEDSKEAGQAVISSDGRYFAVLMVKENEGKFFWSKVFGSELQIMDTYTKEIIGSVDCNYDGCRICAVSADGNHVVTCTFNSSILSNTKNGSSVNLGGSRRISRSIIDFSGNSRRLALVLPLIGSSAETINIVDIESGKELYSVNGKRFTALAYSPKGRYLAAHSFNYGTIIRDAEHDIELFNLDKNEGIYINSISFSPDERRFVTAAGNNTIRIWDTETGNLLLEFGEFREVNQNFRSERITTTACFSPNGQIVAAYFEDGTIQMVNAETGEILKQLKGHPNKEGWVSFTPDGKKLITYSKSHNKILFWGSN
jgi:WD40 repeat protein